MNLKTLLALAALLGSAALVWVGLGRPTGPLAQHPSAPESAERKDGFTADEVERIEIDRGAEKVTFERAKDKSWRLPGDWPAKSSEVEALARTLAELRSRFDALPLGDDPTAFGLDAGLPPPEERLRDVQAAFAGLAVAASPLTAGPLTDKELPRRFLPLHPWPLVVRERGVVFACSAFAAPLAGYPHAAVAALATTLTPAPGALLGLSPTPLYVTVKTAKGTHRLTFGESQDRPSRLDRPTYLRVGDEETVSRLAPGLVALLDRPSDHYQQRRLFPSKREAKEENRPAKAERLQGKELSVEEKGEKRYAITKAGETWELSYPRRDALDPRNRDQLLEAVADLWAEKFVANGPEKFEVEKRLTLTREDGSTMTLEIGPPVPGAGKDKRAYARLVGNPRVFEVAAEKFNDIFPPTLDGLRDVQLARFAVADARELKLTTSAGTIELKNVADRKKAEEPPPPAPGEPPAASPPPPADWRLLPELAVKADGPAVERLLQTVSSLSAIDRDAGLKAEVGAAVGALALPPISAAWFAAPNRAAGLLGVEKPNATVEVVVEEGPLTGGKRKTLSVALGKRDEAGKKLFATSGGYPRVNEVSDALADLIVGKTALDFRGKKLFADLNLKPEDVKSVRVERRSLPGVGLGLFGLSPLAAAASLGEGAAGLTLERTSDGWAITTPVKATADAGRTDELVGRLASLEALAFVGQTGDVPTAEAVLRFGVDRPMLRVHFAGQTLLVGRPRADGPGWFARLDGSPLVFTLANDLVDSLRRDSLAYRPSELWALGGDEVTEFAFTREGQPPFKIVRKGDGWEVTGPFTVAAPKEVADSLVKALTAPRAESYRAHAAKDLAPYGLAKPAVVVTLKTRGGKEQTLRLGAEEDGGRFATTGKGGPVFVVGSELAKAADRSALDFLDRGLLTLDTAAVTGFTRTAGAETLKVAKKDDGWEMLQPAARAADERRVPDLLRLIGGLRAERLVAYAPTDVKPFGLDKPAATVVLEPHKETLLIGAEVEGTGERYAQVKGNPAIGVVAAATAKRLLAPALTLRDHLLARVPDADAMALEAGERKVTFGKPEGSWKVTKPLTAEADHDALEGFLNGLSRLRADEFVAEKPADVKPYGLDKPAARWTLTLDDKTVLDLTVGAKEPAGERRYARLAGGDVVFLLEPKVSAQAVTEYRPRAVLKDIDPVQVESVRFGHREGAFTLTKAGADWKVEGKPEVRLDAAKVSDALSALRDLKLERYVKDDGAVLKLYGLDPVDLVLEVTTPDGKKVLHLGGQEGGTRRRYARLPGTKAKDVFVLDEAASAKLFRTLADLTAKEARP